VYITLGVGAPALRLVDKAVSCAGTVVFRSVFVIVS
jgi:hypothetical protein